MNDLFDDIASDVDYDTPAVLPDDDMAARERVDWHMRMAARYDARLTELDAAFDAEIQRLRRRLEHLQAPLKRALAWHETPVRAWHEALVAQDPTRKTIHLPNGSSKVRTPTRPRIFITDEEAVTAWARENRPEVLRSPLVTTLRETLDIAAVDGGYRAVDHVTGEVVPGTSAEIPAPTWTLDLHPGGDW